MMEYKKISHGFNMLFLLLVVWLLQLNFTGLNLQLLLLSSALLVLSTLVAYLNKPVVNPFHSRDMLPWLLLLLLLWLVISPLFSMAPYKSWLYSWIWLVLPLVFFVYVQLNKAKTYPLRDWIPLAGALLAIVPIYQFHFLPEIYSYRANGTLLDANSFAGLLNLLLLPSIGLLMGKRSAATPSTLSILSLVLMVGGVCATGSRAGMLIMLIGILLLLMLAWRKGQSVKPAFISLIIVALWFMENLFVAGDALLQRVQPLQTGVDPSLSARFMVWQSCWELIQSSPWWGTGIGTFILLYPMTRSVNEVETSGAHVHSDPLQLLLEGGWPLLLIVAMIVLYAGWYFLKQLKLKHHIDMYIVSLSLAVLLAAAHASVNFNFYNASILFVVALYLAVMYVHYHHESIIVVKSIMLTWGIRSLLLLLTILCVSLLYMDDLASSLRKPMMTKGVQATFTADQCDDASLLSRLRPSVPSLALVKGVCALKKNNCKAVNEAITFFDQAIDASPQQAELYAFVAQLELMASQCVVDAKADAHSRLLQSLEVNPGFFGARYLLYSMDMQQNPKVARLWLTDGLKYGMDYKQRDRYKMIIKGFQ